MDHEDETENAAETHRRPRTRLEQAERLRLQRVDGELAVRLAAQAKALSDPTRLTIAAALAATDELCVCELAWVTERAENLVSHHVRALRALGLAASRRYGKMVLDDQIALMVRCVERYVFGRETHMAGSEVLGGVLL